MKKLSPTKVKMNMNQRKMNVAEIVETLLTLNKIGQCPALNEKTVAILGDITQT